MITQGDALMRRTQSHSMQQWPAQPAVQSWQSSHAAALGAAIAVRRVCFQGRPYTMPPAQQRLVSFTNRLALRHCSRGLLSARGMFCTAECWVHMILVYFLAQVLSGCAKPGWHVLCVDERRTGYIMHACYDVEVCASRWLSKLIRGCPCHLL